MKQDRFDQLRWAIETVSKGFNTPIVSRVVANVKEAIRYAGETGQPLPDDFAELRDTYFSDKDYDDLEKE